MTTMRSMNFLTLVAVIGFVRSSSNSVPLIELCNESTSEYHLSDTGFESALRVWFGKPFGFDSDDDDGAFKSKRRPSVVRDPCKLKITAPETSIVSVSFASIFGPDDVRSTSRKSTKMIDASKPSTNVSCMISIYLPENRRRAIWKVNPCQEGEVLPPARLLPPHLRIVWNPPPANESPELLSRTQLVLTALGRDETCQRPDQHACLKNGLLPLMCIADALLCDGIVHCPRDVSDEDTVMCAERASSLQHSSASWEIFANELLKKFSNQHRSNNLPIGSLDNNIFIHRHVISPPSTTTRPPYSVNDVRADSPGDDSDVVNDGVQDAFANYGPWGYLMLGMLICGTVLMVCGFWECCCRKSKPSTHGTTRRTLMDGVARDRNPTVLVLTNERDPVPPRSPPIMQDSAPPPAYDDLDRPPSYCTLFPNLKGDDRLVLDSYVVVPDQQVSLEMDLSSANYAPSSDSTRTVHTESETRNDTAVGERHANRVDDAEAPIAGTAADSAESGVAQEETADSSDDTDVEAGRNRTSVAAQDEDVEPCSRRECDRNENRAQQRPVVVLSDATEESSTS